MTRSWKAGQQVRIAEAAPSHEAAQVEQDPAGTNEVLMINHVGVDLSLGEALRSSSATAWAASSRQALAMRLQPTRAWLGLWTARAIAHALESPGSMATWRS